MGFNDALKEAFIQRISYGLHRSSITTCSKWACEYRVMGAPFPGRWTFDHHPWLKAMHDSRAPFNIGQKSAQVGFTENALNITFYTLDVLGKDVLYVLPAQTPDATVFSASRFDPALELSEHLSKLFSDVKNVTHKRAGTRNLYVRGSHSRGGLKSIPVYLIVLDEVDEMEQENIPLALERTAGQNDYLNWLISTPTIDGEGINSYFRRSTQNHWFFRCPGCSQFINLSFPESIVITSDDPESTDIDRSHYVCTNCSKILDHNLKRQYYQNAQWVSANSNYDDVGWHIHRLYATVPAGHPVRIAKSYLRSLTDPSREQEFFNSTLGQPHAVKGARISDDDINQCIRNYQKFLPAYDMPSGIITMGVDQGLWCHYEIDYWTINKGSDLSNAARPQLLTEGKVRDFEDLDILFNNYDINFVVIDSQPERRKANEFANRHPGRVRLCFYPEGINTKQIHLSDAADEPTVSVDRTTWLDTSLSRFRYNTIDLPTNLSYEYREHIKANVRSYEKDRWGNMIGRYRNGSKDDHLAHARNYSEIALHLCVAKAVNRNVQNVL